VAFATVVLFSCSQDASEVYSCDEEVDAWVKENLADIRIMDREDWLKLDERVKGPAFAAFTPQQKIDFWDNRFQEIIKLDWNENELAHLNLLHATLLENPSWFDSKKMEDEKIQEQFGIFTFKWMNYAMENLKWDKKKIGAIVSSGNRLIDKDGHLEFSKNTNIRLKR
jgi:hypothetical protein